MAKKDWFGAWSLFAALCCMAAPLSAATTGIFGNFTYSDDGTSITITGYPQDAVGAVEIPSTLNGKPVTSIGDNAFYYCTGLTSVTIPSGVTTIGYNAFNNCTGLTSVAIPSSVTSIGSAAFYVCTKLTSVTIPSGVTAIGYDTFARCSGLTSVAIPSSVTSIGNEAFSYCSGLTSVAIPTSVTRLGDGAFLCCTGLTSVEIPSSVTSIGSGAFSYCTGLTSVNFMGNAPTLGPLAFASVASGFRVYYLNGSSGFTSPTWQGYPSAQVALFPQTIIFTALSGKTYGDAPFTVSATASSGLAPIFSIVSGPATISGNTVTPTGTGTVVVRASQAGNASYLAAPTVDRSFYVSPLIFTYNDDGSSITITGITTSFVGDVTIPSTINDKPVTSIGDNAFGYRSGLTSVSIPSSVTSIGTWAFAGCSGLTSATIPSSVTTIGSRAFYVCTGLTSVTISSGVTTIGYDAFAGCTGLTSVEIPSSVTSIEMYAFSYCTKLTSVTIPSSVTNIGMAAFYGCSVLTSASFTGNSPTLGSDAFASAASGFKIYYLDSSSGFTSPTWQGYPSQVLLTQTITFSALSDTPYTTTPFTVSATASSELTPTFTITSGPATISGNTLTLTGVGMVVVRASQSGNANYADATPVDRSFNVTQGTQTITFGALSAKTYGDAPFTLSATASSGLAPTYSIVSGPATISDNTVTITGAGTVVVRASQDGSSLYAAAAPVDQPFAIAKIGQTITFLEPADHLSSDAPIVLSATADSGLPVTFSVVSGPATLGVDGQTLTLTGAAGTVTVRASQTGNTNYLAATPVDRSFTVFKPTKTQTIKFTAPTAKLMGVAPFGLAATATSGLPVTFSVLSGPATLGLNGTTLTVTGAGTVVLQATQSGNTVYLPAKAVQVSFKVSQTAQKITFTLPATAAMSTLPLTLTATASSGLLVTYTVVSGPATLGGDGKTLTVASAGTVVVKATQAGDTVYLAAPAVQKTIKVTQTAQKITFTPPTTAVMSASPFTLTATASSGLPVTFTVVSGPATLGVDGKTLTVTAAGSVVVKATQIGNIVYSAAPAVQKIIKISKVPQTITFSLPTTVTLNASPLTLTATAASGLPVSYVVTGPATLSGQTLTYTGVGTVSVRASQAGNAIYLAAKPVVKKIKVTAASTKAKNLTGKSSSATVLNSLAGDYEALLEGTDASASPGLLIGRVDLRLADTKGNYTALLILPDEAEPLFISGTVEMIGGTPSNPLITAYWPEPGDVSPYTVEFSLSEDGLVVIVSKAGEIIAETNAAVIGK